VPLKDDLLFFILSTRMMPPIAVAIPIYLMYRELGLSDTRLGIMGRFHLPDVAMLSPWVGMGIGYEWGSFSVHQSAIGDTNTDSSWSGFEFANFQTGGDFHVAQKVVVAPFLSVSIGQFRGITTTTTVGNTTTTNDQDLEKTSLHEWILIGARVAFAP